MRGTLSGGIVVSLTGDKGVDFDSCADDTVISGAGGGGTGAEAV